MSFSSAPSAISVDRGDPKHAIVSFGQGPPELVNFHEGKSQPLPILALGESFGCGVEMHCQFIHLLCL
jgi:hypothetical protein